MHLESAVAELELSHSSHLLQVGWDSSQQSMPEGTVFFLRPGFVAQACEEAALPQQVAQAAIAASRRVAGSAPLSALAWHFHHCLFQAADYPRDSISEWPTLEAALQEDGGLFYLLVLLSGMPGLQAVNEGHGVPSEVVRDTLSDIKRWIGGGEEDGPALPPWGLAPRALSWLVNHLRGELYGLGRLQFQFGCSQLQVRVFRRRVSGTVAALSEDGVCYRGDGSRARSDGSEQADSWQASLRVGDGEVMGYPILPTGRALPRQVALRTAEWQQVLAPGQPVLHVHIPVGSPMSHQRCGESFRQAAEFFPRHFPERSFAAFCCGSWLLDGQLQGFLPPTSNIVRFQREVYLVPVRLSPKYLLYRVFGEVPEDLTRAPRQTSLQRALLDHMQAGKQLRPFGGGCFLFAQDLDWGAQVYRQQPFPW